MRPNALFLLLLLPSAAAQNVCNPATLAGPYAFQLSGSTTISGSSKPMATLGRLTFDGSGNITGTASAAFSGVLLGNPVTGTYQAKPDCSIAWKLQDDSGAFQNFTGTLSADGARIQFRQTGVGPGQEGVMQKTPESCSEADLRKSYRFALSGSTTPMQTGDVAHAVSAHGTLNVEENGSFQVDTDCTVHFTLTLPPEASLMTMRGFLVNGGKEILAFQTDPGAMVAARLQSDPK